MYELDEETGEVGFSHNPFSDAAGRPRGARNDGPLRGPGPSSPNIVCNGCELSSGAIRNHRPDILYRAFEIAGYSKQEVDERFGALGRAFRYGPPPHGGIAPGLDRIVILMAGESSIREVIAFPKNQRAQDVMMSAPAPIPPSGCES